MRRKLLSVVLCVCMMMTMAPFAFAEGDGNEVTPTAAPIGTGDAGASTLTAGTWSENKNGNLTITEDNAVIDGNGKTYTNGTITVSAANVTIENLTFGDNAALIVNTTGKFTLTGCTFTPNTVYVKGTDGNADTGIRTAVWLNVGEAVVTNNTFNGVTGGYYNAIEFGIGDTRNGIAQNDLNKATISGNTFSSAIKNNYFNFYNMTANAVIDITGNHFLLAKKGSNAIRISNFRNVSGVTFNVKDNEYSYENASAESIYEGFILLQDYSDPGDTVQNFSGITININNLASPSNAKQLFYVYDNQDGIITTNQPIVKGDSSISKFSSARIGDTYYASLAKAVAAANNSEVTLLKDINLNSSLVVDKKLTLDLGGHTWKATGVKAVYVAGNGDLTLKNGTLESVDIADNLCVAQVDCTATNVAGNAKLTIAKDMTVRANQGCGIALFGSNSQYKATLSVAGKVYAGSPAVSGNGSWNNTDTTIEDSAVLTSSDGTAIYHPQGGTLDIKGGTITGHDSAIAIKSGTLNISGGTIKATGPDTTPTTGYSNGVNASGAAIQIESNKAYYGNPDNTNHTDNDAVQINVTGGNIESQNGVAIYEYLDSGAADKPNTATTQSSVKGINISAGYIKSPKANFMLSEQLSTEKASKISVTGGYFTSDPTPYVKSTNGALRYVVESDTPGYSYMVTDQRPSVAPVIVEDKTETANSIENENVKNSVDAVINNANVDGVAEAVNKDSILNTAGVSGEDKADENSKIVIDVKVKVSATGATTTSDDSNSISTLTFTASPEATVKKVTTSGSTISTTYYKNSNTTPISLPNNYLNGQEITVKLPLPDKFTPQQIKHICNDGSVEYFLDHYERGAKMFTLDENHCAVFTINKFSTFEVSGTQDYVAPSHSSSGTTTTTYNVNVNAATNGTVAADKKTAAKGATVTVTATASTGYVVDSVKVVDKDGKDVAVTVKNGKYVFTMPGSAVTVTGTFKAETPAPSGLPFTDVKSGDWFYGAVKYAYENGLMTGTSATTFAPNGTMNRAMIVTVLYRLEKSPAVTAASKFTDVPAGQWYSDAVAWAAANNIVNGYDETTFGPMNAVTREQLAAILFRYEQVKGLENVTLEENLNRFPDHDKVSAYAVPALQWAVGQKIINGNADGTLDPTGTATRAQVAQILTNLLSK